MRPLKTRMRHETIHGLLCARDAVTQNTRAAVRPKTQEMKGREK